MPLAVACGWLEWAGLGVLGLKLRMWSSSAQQFHSNPPEVHTHHSHSDSDSDYHSDSDSKSSPYLSRNLQHKAIDQTGTFSSHILVFEFYVWKSK